MKNKIRKKFNFLNNKTKSILREAKGLREKISNKIDSKKIELKLNKTPPEYKRFDVVKTEKGDFDDFERDFENYEIKTGIVLGKKKSGKTALGLKFIENLKAKTGNKCFAMGFRKKELPSWIKVVEKTEEIEENSFVLVDEGKVLENSDEYYEDATNLLIELMMITKSKKTGIIFISQNSGNIDENILDLVDFIAIKNIDVMENGNEKESIKQTYEEVRDDFDKYSNMEGLTYLHSEKFRGFISNPVPGFWKEFNKKQVV